VKVGVVGAGRMGRRHIEACGRAGFDVVMISDHNAESLALARQLVPAIEVVESRELVANNNLDLVIVATTTTSHVQLAAEAIENGVPYVLIEKPLGRSLGECDRIVALAAKRGAKVAVNHPYRHMPPFQRLVALVGSDEFGGLSSMHVVGGNGGMAMLLTHFVDLFEMMSGEPVAAVEADLPSMIVPNPRGDQYEDYSGTVRGFTETGHRLVVDLAANQGTGMIATIAGPRGICTFDMLTGSITGRLRDPKDRELPSTQYMFGATFQESPTSPIDIVAGAQSVIESLVSSRPHCTLEQGRRFVEVLITAHMASRTGRRLRLGDESVDREELFPWP